MELQNNSEQMKTVVETFIIEETEELIYDGEKLEQWKELTESLGLEGQKVLAKPKKSPIPFLHMKLNLENIFRCLCPQSDDIQAYNKTPIPLEILSLVALSKKEEYFDKIQIWYDDKSPDPACVGIMDSWRIGETSHTWRDLLPNRFRTKEDAESYVVLESLQHTGVVQSAGSTFYLLGKWADVKRSFSDLADMATTRYIKEQRASHETTIRSYEKYIADLVGEAEQRFSI